ncbi:phosphatase PAP2 family protein [Streptomyces sp. NPDC007264]|uniref:phosphatase PAP2 family protein n=1 Tax=Streptomyces sp. NPDC007264 TaxID=3364777 RepID=UPI0036DB4EB8
MTTSPDPDIRQPPAARTGTHPVPARPARVVAGAALLLLLITWQVAARGPLARVDERLSGDVVGPGRLSGLLADLGSIPVAVPVLALVLVHAASRARRSGADRWWLPSLAAAVCMAAVPALVIPFKELIARPGPAVAGPGTGYYPSGHTATAAVAYGAAAVVLWPWLRSPYARRELLVVCAVLNLGVGLGLVRQGYHWLLDVLASWCLCAMLLTGLVVLLDRSSRTPPGAPGSRTGPG